jgi:lipoprotein-releasing system permease protein
LSWIVALLLALQAAVAAVLVRRRGRAWAGRVAALAGALALLAAALGAPAALKGLDFEREAYPFWAAACVAVAVIGFVCAKRWARLPTSELVIAVILVAEGSAAVVAHTTGGITPASPAFRALIAAPAALLLSGYFGASLGYLVGRSAGGDLRIGYEGLIARRYLLSKASPVLSTVTTISVMGVALGVALVIVSLAVLAGLAGDLESKIIGANAHVVVETKDGRPFVLSEAMAANIASTPGVVAANPIIEGEVAVSSSSNYLGALLFGIDPNVAPRVLSVLQPLAERPPATGHRSPSTGELLVGPEEMGSLVPLVEEMSAPPAAVGGGGAAREEGEEFAPPAALAKIVIGAEMAKGLSIGVGDRIRVVSPMLETMTPVGPAPKSVAFEVAGVFTSKMYDFDARYAFISLPAARRFLELDPQQVTGVQLATSNAELADDVARQVQSRLGSGFEAVDWKARNQTLFSALKLERVVAFVVLVFIILVASFAIVNTLTMSIIEKQKEIAILKTMGATDGGIMKLFLAQGLLVGTFGTLVGVTLGIGLVALLQRFGFSIPGDVYYIDSLPVRLEVSDLLLVVLAALLIIWDFAVFPALRGSRLSPVEGLRDG